MRIEEDTKLDFSDVLIRPKRSSMKSRSEVSLEREFKFRLRDGNASFSCVPIMSANMDTVGTFRIAEQLIPLGGMVAIHKHYSVEQWAENYNRFFINGISVNHLVYTMGMGSDGNSQYQEVEKAQRVLGACPGVNFICLDVANGYTERFAEYVKTIRGLFPNHVLIAGNVVTREMTEALLLAGANIVKVGIGPGSVCTTRRVAGVGYPQLSAIAECADAAHGLGGYVIGDGGCTCPGDVAKAFGAGADFVMLGGMFAGADEAEGEVIGDRKQFYGMSSCAAMNKYSGGIAKHRASEGKIVGVPLTGPIAETVREITGGLRSACTYVGARRLKDLPKCTTFVRVNRQLNTVWGNG